MDPSGEDDHFYLTSLVLTTLLFSYPLLASFFFSFSLSRYYVSGFSSFVFLSRFESLAAFGLYAFFFFHASFHAHHEALVPCISFPVTVSFQCGFWI